MLGGLGKGTSLKKIKIVSVKTNFTFLDCDPIAQPTEKILWGIGRGNLAEHTPIPLVGTKNQMCP